MLDSAILDVVIGLVFIYVALSFAVSMGTETISILFSLRANTLYQGIARLIGDASVVKTDNEGKKTNVALVKQFFDHQLIAPLARPGKKYPDKIPVELMTTVFLDLIAPPSTAPKNESPNTANPPRPITQLKAALAQSGGDQNDIRTALGAFLHEAGDDVEKAKAAFTSWLNIGMDRVSDWYKRKAYILNIGIAFVICGAANADTLAIIDSLSIDESLRTAVVAAATEASKNSDTTEGVKAIVDASTSLQLPLGWGRENVFTDPKSGVMQMINWGIGILISVSAASLGAPFWFHILKSLVALRQTKLFQTSEQQPGKQ